MHPEQLEGFIKFVAAPSRAAEHERMGTKAPVKPSSHLTSQQSENYAFAAVLARCR